jgi:hypothetical protein
MSMNRQKASCAAFYLLGLCATFPAAAQNSPAIPVSIQVKAQPRFEDELRACIYREVRALGDTQIVEEKALFALWVVAVESNGYRASVVILDHADARKLAEGQTMPGTTAREILDKMKADAFVLPANVFTLGRLQTHHLVQFADVPKLCSYVVTTLNTLVIDAARRALIRETAP